MFKEINGIEYLIHVFSIEHKALIFDYTSNGRGMYKFVHFDEALKNGWLTQEELNQLIEEEKEALEEMGLLS